MEDGGGIDGVRAGDVEADGLEGPDLDAKAVFEVGIEHAAALVFVVAADALCGELEGLPQLRCDGRESGIDLFPRHLESGVGHAIEGLAVAADGSVAFSPHI